MPTVSMRACEEAAWRYIRSHGGQALATVREGLREGRWPADYADSLGQPHMGWTNGELFAWSRLHALTFAGNLARVMVEVGEEPRADRYRAENAAALADIAEPFVAHLNLTQNNADQDGRLEWTETITASLTKGWLVDGAGLQTTEGMVDIAAGPTLPLEVGSCNPSTVLMHIYRSGGIARWPYGSGRAWVFIGAPNPGAWCAEHGMAKVMSDLLNIADDEADAPPLP